MVLMCDHWPLELAVNGHWYGAVCSVKAEKAVETCSEG